MGFKTIEAKFGNMRKTQRFVVTLSNKGNFIVQSQKSIGRFDMVSGEGLLNTHGSYFHHLSPTLGAQPFTFPQDFVKECCAAFPLANDLIGASAETGPVYYGGTTEIGHEDLPAIDGNLSMLYNIASYGLNGFEIINDGCQVAKFTLSGDQRTNYWQAVRWARRNAEQNDYIVANHEDTNTYSRE